MSSENIFLAGYGIFVDLGRLIEIMWSGYEILSSYNRYDQSIIEPKYKIYKDHKSKK